MHSTQAVRPHSQHIRFIPSHTNVCRSCAPSRRAAMPLHALQSGWNPQQQPQQPMQPQPSLQPQGQMGQIGQMGRQPMPSTRTAAPYQPAGSVFLDLTQVLQKQVITRTSGRCLGCISGAWLDPAAGTVVSFDLDERRQAPGGLGSLSTPPRAGNIPLSALRQIGDVVLVHDESGLYEQDLDSRLGFVNPVGLDVRTRAGEFLGKVRDLSFSPDTGAIKRITYDEFGLPFLPISFFDCYSVAMQDVISIGRGDLLVYDDAKYRERKESAGLFAAIPSLLKSLNGPSRPGSAQLALPAPGGTSDMYRLGGPGSTTGAISSSSSSRFLPTDYTYEQWQADLRRWEAETGMTYEQYLRAQPQQPAAAGPRTALPPGRSSPAPGYAAPGYGGQQYTPQQQPQQQQQLQQPGYTQPQQMPRPQQQQQQQLYTQQPAPQQFQPSVPAWQQQQQPQQQYAARPAQQQYPMGYGQQGLAGGFAAGQNPSASAPGNPYSTAPAVERRSTTPQQQRNLGQPAQQQTVTGTQAQPKASQKVLQSQPGAAKMPSAAQTSQQRQQPQQVQGNAVNNGVVDSFNSQNGQVAQQVEQQRMQQPSGSTGGARPVNEWLGETRPRIADALADGVLPSSADAPAAPTRYEESPAQVQQEVA